MKLLKMAKKTISNCLKKSRIGWQQMKSNLGRNRRNNFSWKRVKIHSLSKLCHWPVRRKNARKVHLRILTTTSKQKTSMKSRRERKSWSTSTSGEVRRSCPAAPNSSFSAVWKTSLLRSWMQTTRNAWMLTMSCVQQMTPCKPNRPKLHFWTKKCWKGRQSTTKKSSTSARTAATAKSKKTWLKATSTSTCSRFWQTPKQLPTGNSLDLKTWNGRRRLWNS